VDAAGVLLSSTPSLEKLPNRPAVPVAEALPPLDFTKDLKAKIDAIQARVTRCRTIFNCTEACPSRGPHHQGHRRGEEGDPQGLPRHPRPPGCRRPRVTGWLIGG
jgi:CO dehydrogenase/acetyl-CoA synthase alpha subunit